MGNQRVWTADEIKQGLKSSDEWVIEGIKTIYRYQTAQEQAAGLTQEDNGVGFNGPDSAILSSFAQQINSWNPNRFRTPLSPRQMEIARQKIIKYGGQLAKIANKEI